MFENPRRGRQARNFTTNVPKILVLKSSSEQIFSRKLPLGAPVDSAIQRLNNRGLTDKPEADDAHISSLLSLHQCSVLQVLKAI